MLRYLKIYLLDVVAAMAKAKAKIIFFASMSCSCLVENINKLRSEIVRNGAKPRVCIYKVTHGRQFNKRVTLTAC